MFLGERFETRRNDASNEREQKRRNDVITTPTMNRSGTDLLRPCNATEPIFTLVLSSTMAYLSSSLPSIADITDPVSLHNLLRLVIVVATYLLFRPYLSQFLRYISGAPDTREEQVKARVAAMVEEQEKTKKEG